MDNNTIDYGKLIATVREHYNITQQELGNLIGVGKTMVSNYETSYTTPSVRTLEKIASVLGMTLVEFLAFGKEGNPELSLPRAMQPTSDKCIRYLQFKNLTKEKLETDFYMDYYLTVPGFMLNTTDQYVCIKMPDNSMKKSGIRKNDFVIIKITDAIADNSIVLAISKLSGKAVIRRYMRENRFVTLLPDSCDNNYSIIRYDERDAEFEIFGYVEKVLTNIQEM